MRGYEERYGLYQKFYSFKGIPYAEPPIGNLRFKAPKPHRGWSGIRDAYKHGYHCPSNGFLIFLSGGNEDCLFLNVYTPNIDNEKRAVMVWVHGGAYLLSDGNTLVYGAGPLMREDIVLVTLNYRLVDKFKNSVGKFIKLYIIMLRIYKLYFLMQAWNFRFLQYRR